MMRRYGKALGPLAYAILIAGFVLLGGYAFVKIEASVFQHQQAAKLARGLGATAVTHKGATLGRLEIPRINLSPIVVEGDDDALLRVAAGHIPHTAFAGQSGNFGIAAHRDTFFHSLGNVRRGDVVTFQSSSGTFQYRVDSVEVVRPDDVAVLRASSSRELTLVTCFPFHYIGPAPERFVVRAREIAFEQIPSPGTSQR